MATRFKCAIALLVLALAMGCVSPAPLPTDTPPGSVGSLSGTTWRLEPSGIVVESSMWEFLSDGRVRSFNTKFNFSEEVDPGGDPEITSRSAWEQDGATVRIYINDKVSTNVGTLSGDYMYGTGSNQMGMDWTWKAYRIK